MKNKYQLNLEVYNYSEKIAPLPHCPIVFFVVSVGQWNNGTIKLIIYLIYLT